MFRSLTVCLVFGSVLSCFVNVDEAFLFNKQPGTLIIQIYSVIKLYRFGHLLFSSSGVFHCTFGFGMFHGGLMTASKDGMAVINLNNNKTAE